MEELEAAHWEGAEGTETSHRYTAAVDNLLRFILEAATDRFSRRYTRARQHCAVIGQGSYGRRELSPHSDLDILVVYPGAMSPFVETVAESLLYSLWDAGLQVGHAVRTPEECVALAKTDLTIKTALIDGRFVCGSPEVGAEFVEKVQDVVAATDVEGFVAAKLEESRERHERWGGSVFMLEPNVKEGQGGLRDLHTVDWITKVRTGVVGLEQLAEAEVLSEGELEEVLAARDFLFRIRNALHFLAGKQENLNFDRQDIIAERFGYVADGDNTASDLLMRDYYRHASIISRTSADILDRLPSDSDKSGLIDKLVSRTVRESVSIVRGRIEAAPASFEDDPVEMLRVIHDAQRNAVPLSNHTREAIRRHSARLDADFAEDEDAITVLLEVLRYKEGVYESLSLMNRLGLLGRLVPEFGRLFCMVQHDYYHVYTVDEHSLIGIRELEALRDGEYAKTSPLLTQIMRECDHPELLYLGMMFHDLGKGYGGDHDEKGALMVRDIAGRMGLHPDDIAALEFLVRHHLAMSHLAQTRDISDAMLVADFVKLVGDTQKLRLLYLLTFADMKAVGPKVWSGWKNDLLATLYLQSIEMFNKGLVTQADLGDRVEAIKARVTAQVSGEGDVARLKGYLDSMPDAYLLSTDRKSILDHWRLYQSLGSALFTSGTRLFPERGFTIFTVCTPDQPGVFLRIAGALLANGLNVLGARLSKTEDDIVIDAFRIANNGGAADPLDPQVWANVRESLQGVLSDELDVDILVADARKSTESTIAGSKTRRRMPVKIEIDNDVSSDYTVLDIYAPDRPGLLFTVASCIYHLGLVIHLAKITTHVNRVLDVFYVTDAKGEKITDEERLEEICAILIETIEEDEKPAEDKSTAGETRAYTH